MYIKSFNIDNFGIFSQISLQDLPEGLAIFLGKNEAGKSTCLEFFRTILTGFPLIKKNDIQNRNFATLRPGSSGLVGGSLSLYTNEKGLINVTRRPGKGNESLILTDEHGNALDTMLMENILAGVNRDMYRNVFGFSLSELQVFESLHDDKVRHALYGASFGMNMRSPGEILKELETKMEKLFKVRGTSPFINATLKNIEEIQKEIAAIKKECAQYDALSQERTELESTLQSLRERKTLCEQERRDAERQLGVWKQWDEWQNVEDQLSRLEPVANTFPEDGVGRLERAQLVLQQAIRRADTEEERHRKLEAKLSEIEPIINHTLIKKRNNLQSLSEHKASFRQAQDGLVLKEAHLQKAHIQLNTHLQDLGPDWTCERIHSIDRSLLARNELEQKSSDIQAAEQARIAATLHLEKSNTSVVSTKQAVEQAQDTLEKMPKPQELANEEERENIRRYSALLENTCQSLKEKEVTLSNVKQTFMRALSPLTLSSEEGQVKQSIKDALPILEGIKNSQDEALPLAVNAQEARKVCLDVEQQVAQAQENEDVARLRYERLRKHIQKNTITSRERIDERATAIRGLRHLYTNFCLERDRLAEIVERLENSIAPKPVKSVALMIIGGIIILCGLAALALPIYFDIHQIQISPKHILPLSQWSSYLVVLTGAGFLSGGLPRSGPESKRYAQEMEELNQRGNGIQAELSEMENKIKNLCTVAEVTDADPITLDAVEILLEREREKCATNERMSLDMGDLEAEYNELVQKTKAKRLELSKAQQQEQQALFKWHECLRMQQVSTIPSPDAATTFFAKVESALMAQANAQNLEDEVNQLRANKDEYKEKLCNIPAIMNNLVSELHLKQEQSLDLVTQESTADYGEENILLAVQRVLDACRDADEALAERLKAAATLDNAKHNQELAEKSLLEASQNAQQAEEQWKEAREAWAKRLQDMGLQMDVSPSLIHSVLECMEKCLTVEADITRMAEEKERMQRQCELFVEPLRAILEATSKDLPVATLNSDLPYQENWVQSLDDLLLDLHATSDAENIQQQLQEQINTHTEELHETSKALSDAKANIKHLLTMAQTEDEEEFVRLAKVHAQRLELSRRKGDLEHALRLAAANKDFDEFLASFASREKHECEYFLHEKERELQELLVKEQENMHAFASVESTLHHITSTDTLAKLRQEESNLQASLHSASQQWSQLAVARQLLMQAKQRFEKERQPQVIRLASEIFARITDEKWKGLSASLEDNSLHVISPAGEPLSPFILSRGTQEQLYLSLRLAYIRNHASHATALPVIMDDVLVNFDPERAERTGQALLDLSQTGKRHQVLFFTCHPHMADMLQKNYPESKKYIVENQSIREDA